MELITLEERSGVRIVGLDRPEKRNALDRAMVDELHEVLRSSASSDPKVLVVRSTTPGMFVSGADIGELVDRSADDALQSINAGLFDAIEAYRWPSIAVVDGAAFGGGCELALACDFRLCSRSARFAQPELNLGIIAGAGGNWRLQQLVGLGLARRMLFAGEVLDADQALESGLVDAVHDGDELLEAALSLAERIGERSWKALELTKLALRQNRPATTGFDIAAQALLFESDEKRQRMTAFLDRKSPRPDDPAG